MWSETSEIYWEQIHFFWFTVGNCIQIRLFSPKTGAGRWCNGRAFVSHEVPQWFACCSCWLWEKLNIHWCVTDLPSQCSKAGLLKAILCVIMPYNACKISQLFVTGIGFGAASKNLLSVCCCMAFDKVVIGHRLDKFMICQWTFNFFQT